MVKVILAIFTWASAQQHCTLTCDYCSTARLLLFLNTQLCAAGGFGSSMHFATGCLACWKLLVHVEEKADFLKLPP